MNGLLNKFETNVTQTTFNGRRIFGFVHPPITGKMRQDSWLFYTVCADKVIHTDVVLRALDEDKQEYFIARQKVLFFVHFSLG